MRGIVGLFHKTYIVSAMNFSYHRWTENIGKMVAWCQVPDHDRLRCPCHRRHWSWGGWRRGQDQVWSSSCQTVEKLPPPSHPACTCCSQHLSELKLFLGYIRCHTCLVWGKGEDVKIHPRKHLAPEIIKHLGFLTVQHRNSDKIQTFSFRYFNCREHVWFLHHHPFYVPTKSIRNIYSCLKWRWSLRCWCCWWLWYVNWWHSWNSFSANWSNEWTTYQEVWGLDPMSSSESSETVHSWLTPSTTPRELIVSSWLPVVYLQPEMDMSHIKLFVRFLIRKVLTV